MPLSGQLKTMFTMPFSVPLAHLIGTVATSTHLLTAFQAA